MNQQVEQATQQPTSFEAFEASARGQGFDEVIVREWAPGQVLEDHRHPFEVKAWVVRGEVTLTEDGRTRVLHAGDSFELERDAPHKERYGPEGATFWVARRHTPA
jgi:quercetin dioxygenase-like cupin family protein